MILTYNIIKHILKGVTLMATITVRYNDDSKAQAEAIASAIGISLSSAISIFLNRFVAEKGFPFDVTAPTKKQALFSGADMDVLFSEAIKNSSAVATLPPSAYLDESGNLKHTE